MLIIVIKIFFLIYSLSMHYDFTISNLLLKIDEARLIITVSRLRDGIETAMV